MRNSRFLIFVKVVARAADLGRYYSISFTRLSIGFLFLFLLFSLLPFLRDDGH
jgi:hypothetical protein